MPRQKDYLKPFRKAAVGLTELGLSTAVGAGITSRGPARASVMGGFRTFTGFIPIVITPVGGKAVLDVLKKNKKR